jgi:hypothetical protein
MVIDELIEAFKRNFTVYKKNFLLKHCLGIMKQNKFNWYLIKLLYGCGGGAESGLVGPRLERIVARPRSV